MAKSLSVSEFGVIRPLGSYGTGECRESFSDRENNAVYLDQKSFNQLADFVTANQDPISGKESPLQYFTKHRHPQIRVTNYVGTIQTLNGTIIEIMPKIYQVGKDATKRTKELFFRMLARLQDTPFRKLGTAELMTRKNFPVLEAFIAEYADECGRLLMKGLRSDFRETADNIGTVRGKLLVKENIRHNYINKARFYCAFDEHDCNNAQNRIVKSALAKLISVSRIQSNKRDLERYAMMMEDVPESADVAKDLAFCLRNMKLFTGYERILEWSELFLRGEAFTNYSGNSVNAALLFPMERVFQDYVAYLFKKYSDGRIVRTQERKYFLIERHAGKPKFGLQPDMVIDTESSDRITDRVIIDTKWKVISSQKSGKSNYGLDGKDIYQLFAYGKKCYDKDQVDPGDVFNPRLVMLYPKNADFTEKLEPFEYEKGLILNIFPFDLEADPKDEVGRLMEEMYCDQS